MKRIKPQEILDAYNETHIIPVNADWGFTVRDDGSKCGCALTALGASKVGFDEFLQGIFDKHYEYVAELLGYDEEYLMGFVYGFDSIIFLYDKSEAFQLGAKDGVTARREVADNIGFRKAPSNLYPIGYDYE